MKVLKKHKTDYFKDVVIMNKSCGHPEYYGCIVMRDGINYCRQCIYEIWQKEQNYKGWKPGETDYVFPLYTDGIDYQCKSKK